MNLRRWNFL